MGRFEKYIAGLKWVIGLEIDRCDEMGRYWGWNESLDEMDRQVEIFSEC